MPSLQHLLVACSLALSLNCASAADTHGATTATIAAATPVHGGTFTYAVAQEPTTLVSFLDTKTDNRNISAKITEGLLRYDLDFKPQPLLATAWRISPDGLRYTFTLRQGVKFHDGADFTADDVRYSILKQKERGPRGSITLANVKDVEMPDAHTAVIVLSKPAPYLINALSSAELPIVPHHVYGDGDPLNSPNISHPIGTGPFMFKEWARGSHLVLERNPNYWRKDRPYLDRVIYRFINDTAAISAAIETGEVNGALNVALSDLDRLQKNPKLRVDDSDDGFLNNALFLEFNLENPILANAKVRHAIAYAIDRHFIGKTIYYGRAQVVNSPVPAVLSRYYDDSAFDYPTDLAHANALLDEAGYPRKDAGTRFELRLSFLPSANFKRVSEYLRATLNRVGIKVAILDGDLPTFLNRVYKERGFDLNVNGLSRLFDPTVGVQRIFWSESLQKAIPWINASHYRNPKVDDLFRQAATETDETRRAAEFKEIQSIVGRDLPVLPLVTVPASLQVYQARVHGLNNSVDLTSGDYADLWLEPESHKEAP
ncbi:peptide ABC transporter substrate-binding protein [Bordetella genomosp. 10]|uniref:Peptide ABC transporter substrate-binding protein n=1 Tax=Bordetella genomosp. 10 TaxID=1416804 RepID=A0A261SK67_9BORD|nr:ABC transporter substrate-binding protein [Bordetella genomosp. 10]OZI37828.1 peptide ABC transporter substrate-binding protein [Bordetella genomosp. 10]